MANDTPETRVTIQALQGKQRPVSKKVEPLLPEIEQKISEGFALADIVEALNEQGIEITLLNFKSILYRYRKKVAKNRQATVAEQQPEKAHLQEPDGNPVKNTVESKPAIETVKQHSEDDEKQPTEKLDDILKRQAKNEYEQPEPSTRKRKLGSRNQ